MNADDSNELQVLGQKLAISLLGAYAGGETGGDLVFLPGGISVPDDIVQLQPPVVNLAQLASWLAAYFDFPYTVASGTAAVLALEEKYGTASAIYATAVNEAQPVGDPASEAWNRVIAEIAAAKQSLGPPASQNLGCSPDDWPLPTATGYWSTFNSSQAISSSSSSQASSSPALHYTPIVDGNFWQLRSLGPVTTLKYIPGIVSVPPRIETLNSVVLSRELPTPEPTDKIPIQVPIHPPILGPQDNVMRPTVAFTGDIVKNVTSSSSSTISIQLEHQLVAIDRFTGGQPWWDGVFLTDPAWCIPGMKSGGLLPASSDAAHGAVYGLPIAMIVVRNLQISGQWSQEASAALQSQGATIGPFSFSNATTVTSEGGLTVTFSHEGMQVVALMCSALPVLPPSDSPSTTTSAASASVPNSSSGSSSAATSIT